jgi:UDP-2-acetamido-3-amino-2,3-dideoxy-glucuronate N-acetyltransferase
MIYYAHPSAIIDEGCQIGEGTKIWHFSHIMPKSCIGKKCTIGQNVFIAANVVIGDNVKVQNNVSVYEGVICEDDVFIGPSAVFTNILNPRSAVSRKGDYQKTIIRKGATIGANATILCGIEIGQYAFIGAGTVVTKPVAAYVLLTGNPGKQSGWMSEKGSKLIFDATGKAVCKESNEIYQLKNSNVSKLTPKS